MSTGNRTRRRGSPAASGLCSAPAVLGGNVLPEPVGIDTQDENDQGNRMLRKGRVAFHKHRSVGVTLLIQAFNLLPKTLGLRCKSLDWPRRPFRSDRIPLCCLGSARSLCPSLSALLAFPKFFVLFTLTFVPAVISSFLPPSSSWKLLPL